MRFRFSPDTETSMGLVQHEGGPCSVLATIQAEIIISKLTKEKKWSNQERENLHCDVAFKALPRVVQILVTEQKWDKLRQGQEVEKANRFLQTFNALNNA
ncbi:uncharacterized protein LOC141684788 isoform X2 [Apium graveolens]|uniref:uncharacterized protein LOC141684788 isoform X2 n=1 Tax=Apium graveolens TaxID=4045 RepID=UPI003D7B3D87